jgi:hypothetical protein
MDNSLDPDWMQMGILTLYGFDPMRDCAARKPTKLKEFITICVVAVKYEIEGLLDTALEATSNILTECLSYKDEYETVLPEFLGDGWLDGWCEMITEERYTPLMFRVLREHLPTLYNRTLFQNLLDQEPSLVRCLLDAMVEDQAQRAKERR